MSKKTAVKQKHFMKFPPHFQEVFKNTGYRKATAYVEKKTLGIKKIKGIASAIGLMNNVLSYIKFHQIDSMW